jgi:peptidoglycan/LPS O-acetylase OafA/YrhL
MMVVAHHLYFNNTELGPFGVKIFFVISGFVMWLTTAAIDISPVSFWRRRLVRIVPLYWFFLSLLVVIGLSAPRYLKTTEINLETVVKSFLFIPHFHTVQKLIAPILIPGWSLNYEMFFYLIFGIALLIKPDSRRVMIIGVLLCGLVLIGSLFQPQGAVAATYTNPDLLLFLEGIGLAMIYRAYNIDRAMMGVALICIGILSRFIVFPDRLGLFENLIGLAPALIVAGTLALEPTIRVRPSVVLYAIGNASYSIYLSHLFFLRLSELGWRTFVTFGSGEVTEVAYAVVAFVFAMVGGIAVHYFLERPMLRLFQRSKMATKSAEMA